jgi:DNA-binding MarR family transcriptional regulator
VAVERRGILRGLRQHDGEKMSRMPVESDQFQRCTGQYQRNDFNQHNMNDSSIDNLQLDQQICFPLYAATNLLQQLYRPLLRPLGLTYTQYLVMMVMWEATARHEVVTVGDLCTCLYLDIGTLSPLLKRMEKLGHLIRMRSSQDQRKVLVALTSAGQALKESARAVPVQLAGELGIEPASLGDFREDARALVMTLSKKVHPT